MDGRVADLAAQLERAQGRSQALESQNRMLEHFVGLHNRLVSREADVRHPTVWWLDDVTRQMIEQRLHLDGMLSFTLRGGDPICLTKEQVSSRPLLPHSTEMGLSKKISALRLSWR